MVEREQKRPLFEAAIVRRALGDSWRKLAPRVVAKNPVMFVVEVGSVLTTLLICRDVAAGQTAHLGFTIQVTIWLWFSVEGTSRMKTRRRFEFRLTGLARGPSLPPAHWGAPRAARSLTRCRPWRGGGP